MLFKPVLEEISKSIAAFKKIMSKQQRSKFKQHYTMYIIVSILLACDSLVAGKWQW